jgi:hypothetical protein
MKRIVILSLMYLLAANTLYGQKSVSFDGTNDFIEWDVTSVHQITTNLTVEAWIKPSANTEYAGIVNNVWHTGTQQSGYGLLMGGGLNVYFVAATASGIYYLPGAISSLNTWTHVAGTYDGSMMRLYVNGAEVATYSMTGNIQYTYPNQLRVGRYFDDGAEVYHYAGLIDEARIWNVVRTQNQLQQYDSTELAGNETGLVGYWKFNEGSDIYAYDGTSNVKTGTLYNGVGWVGETGLPVELTALSVEVSQSIAQLKWRTETEKNNYGFDIERRVIGGQWNKVGFVKGHGTSNSPLEYSFIDSKLTAGSYAYRIKQIDNDGAFKYSSELEIKIEVLKEFALSQNYPNPFNPSTKIEFTLLEDGFTTLKIYDILGREVAVLVNRNLNAGILHQVEFNASKLTSGLYFSVLKSGNQKIVKKMMLTK